jgi:lysophospholipase L1-like esterase
MSRRANIVLWASVACYAIVLHVALGVLVIKTDFLYLAGKTLGWVPPEEWTPRLYAEILKQAELDASVPAGSVILLGDSLIAGLDSRAVSQEAVNFGIGGDTTHTLYSRLPVLRSVSRSRIVVVGVGVNDLKYRAADRIASDYASVLDRMASVPQILALSILPVDEGGLAAADRPYLRNRTIMELNQALRRVCRERANCLFIDAWPVIANAAADVYSSDGWHLSLAGSRLLAALLHRTLKSL